jgi:hypothetical protein
MSLSYQKASQNPFFGFSTEMNIIKNRLCEIKKKLESFLNLTNEVVVIEVRINISSYYNNIIIQIWNDKGENQGIIVKTHTAGLYNGQYNLLEINKTTQEVTLAYPTDTFTDPLATIQIVGELILNATLVSIAKLLYIKYRWIIISKCK